MAKGDHDATMTAINQNRGQMNSQYGNSNNMFGGGFNNAQNQYGSSRDNALAGINSFKPNYSFTNQFNNETMTGSGGNNSGWWNGNNGGINGGGFNNGYQGNIERPINTATSNGGSNQYQDLAKQAVAKGLTGQAAVDWINSIQPGVAQFVNAGGASDPNKLTWYDKGGGFGKFQGTDESGKPWEYRNTPGSNGTEWSINTSFNDGPGSGGGIGPQMDLSFLQNWNPEARSYYRKFADTGGYSDQDIQDIRRRSLAPTEGMYANAKNQMARGLALNPNNGANYNAALARMTREGNNQIAEQNIGVNSNIAQMVNAGKQFGTSGLGGLDTTQLQGLLGGNEANLNAAMQMKGIQSQQEIMGNQQQLQKIAMQLQAAGMDQNQISQYMNAYLQNQGQMGNYGLGSIGAQTGASQIPGDFASAMGNVGSVLGLGGTIGGALGGLPFFGNGSLANHGMPYFGGNNYTNLPGYGMGMS